MVYLANLLDPALLFMAGELTMASAKAGITKLSPLKYRQGRKPPDLRGG